MDKMLASLEKIGGSSGFTVFGGEPLLTPLADLEKFLESSFKLSGSSGVQTNASLITEAHFEMFEKYKTHVGVSIDGPAELNDARRLETLEATRSATAKSCAALEELLRREIPCSLILTLHSLNASRSRIKLLLSWLQTLAELGLQNARLHLLEVDSPEAAKLALGEEEAFEALVTLHRAEPMLGIHFDIFKEMLALLRGDDESTTCIWNACDPQTTAAVQAVGPQGELLNCARTYKTDVSWLKSETPSYARQLALYATPFADGGCADCRFFLMCKGQCPGEAMLGDPRNRSANCGIWFRLFEHLEAALLATRELPLSLAPHRKQIEAAALWEWEAGRQVSIRRASALASRGSGFNSSSAVEHGDAHGDHTDFGGRK
jgi:uncharacterized protein